MGMAHYTFEDMAQQAQVPVTVFSRGVAAHGEPANPHAVDTLESNSISSTVRAHVSQQLSSDDVASADIIVVMTANHKATVLNLHPEASCKIRLLLEFVGSDEDIADPIGQSLQVYNDTFSQMQPALKALLGKIAAGET